MFTSFEIKVVRNYSDYLGADRNKRILLANARHIEFVASRNACDDISDDQH